MEILFGGVIAGNTFIYMLVVISLLEHSAKNYSKMKKRLIIDTISQ